MLTLIRVNFNSARNDAITTVNSREQQRKQLKASSGVPPYHTFTPEIRLHRKLTTWNGALVIIFFLMDNDTSDLAVIPSVLQLHQKTNLINENRLSSAVV